jgi:integrase
VYLNERFDVVIRQQGENGAPDAVIEVASGINCLELASAILDFRFHDKRHDFATKLLRESRNLKLVQKALNHRNIKTTLKYAHVLDDEIADAIEAMQEKREKSRNKSRNGLRKIG